ncbi:MAG: LacI family DNA-binding transcriptional regulator [Puniceicoccaceae bacterium]
MASIRSISEETKFSVATVSEALRNTGRVKKETRDIILAAADRMGYQRNALVGDVMSRIRKSQATDFNGTIGVLETVSFHRNRGYSRWHKELFDGAKKRSEELGYKLEFFQFKLEQRSLKRLEQILLARGISAVLLPPYTNPRDLDVIDWDLFTTVQLDYGLQKMRMHTVLPDHHTSLLKALAKLEKMGYRRPGLMVERFQDERIFMKWLAAYKAFETQSSECESVPVFEPYDLTKEEFFDWFRRARPDVIIGHRSDVIGWLDEKGLKVPEDVGFFSLNLHHTPDETAGLNLLPDQLGKAAIEVLVSSLHRQETGVPEVPHTTSLQALVVDGPTIRQMD